MTEASPFSLALPDPLTPDLVPWARIVYSSRSGNTQAVAEHLAGSFGLSAVNARAELEARMEDRGPDGRLLRGDTAGTADEILLLGFWAWRCGPNPTMRDFMRGLRRRRVFLFGTMAAWPDSEHARDCLACARELLAEGGNELLGHFFCQGRLAPAVRRNSRHPRTPERERRLDEAEKHPDAADLAAADAAARAVLTPLMP